MLRHKMINFEKTDKMIRKFSLLAESPKNTRSSKASRKRNSRGEILTIEDESFEEES